MLLMAIASVVVAWLVEPVRVPAVALAVLAGCALVITPARGRLGRPKACGSAVAGSPCARRRRHPRHQRLDARRAHRRSACRRGHRPAPRRPAVRRLRDARPDPRRPVEGRHGTPASTSPVGRELRDVDRARGLSRHCSWWPGWCLAGLSSDDSAGHADSMVAGAAGPRRDRRRRGDATAGLGRRARPARRRRRPALALTARTRLRGRPGRGSCSWWPPPRSPPHPWGLVAHLARRRGVLVASRTRQGAGPAPADLRSAGRPAGLAGRRRMVDAARPRRSGHASGGRCSGAVGGPRGSRLVLREHVMRLAVEGSAASGGLRGAGRRSGRRRACRAMDSRRRGTHRAGAAAIKDRRWYVWLGRGCAGRRVHPADRRQRLLVRRGLHAAARAPSRSRPVPTSRAASRTSAPGLVLGPGLALALLPSVPQALADPTELRALLLGLGAVVALLAGIKLGLAGTVRRGCRRR